MTFDSSFSHASVSADADNEQLPAPPAEIHVSAPTKARKVRTVKAPTAALFAPVASSAYRGAYAVTATRDDDTGLDVTVSTVGTAMRVTYHGPNDRTLVAGLKSKQGAAPVIDNAQAWGAEALAASTFRAATLDAATVADALAHVMPAMSTDATRYNLSGLFLDAKTGNVVASDGHRLHLYSALESPFDAGVIIPRHAVMALDRAIKATKAESVIIGAAHNMVVFVVGTDQLTVEIRARLVDARFPDYTQVIPPTQGERAYTGDAASVRAALKAAPVIGDKGVSRRLEFCADGTGVVTWRHDRVPFAVGLDGYAAKAFVAHFNARYLDQAFAELDGAVAVYLPDEMSPMRIDNGPRMIIIMPMRG